MTSSVITPSAVVRRAPVNPNATPEVRALLDHLYEISGSRTMTGQHNTPREISQYSDEAQTITGQYPAVWGQDFGFSEDGDMDGVNFRPAIVAEAIRQHAAGSIVTLMWHAVRPTEDEPVTFEGSICKGKLDDDDWADLITPGTAIHARWTQQVDVIAGFLTQLKEAGVPVIWRPYHELNGAWFWWGARGGADGYAALYRQMYDRFVHVHHLDNLLWVWNASTPNEKILPYADCYPGHEYVDALAVDIYANEFYQPAYVGLAELAEGRPIALGEVGNAPTPEILEAQPLWTWFMIWTNFLTKENSPEDLRALFHSARALNRPAESQ
ncbi:hypothetical protein CCAX7_32600 [Capsulimonas corticalis]|uniref:Uncharacterized protein n=1 Tax=Capsulimonas corticalis TaxID=2219043 RepID=A0A402D481_9BACT|nr:glycosyl hydrolase [Capsulimonas corticalis]BDI31209.1 hypothetical protein CCAX7_32600 [Capsulimonas corticalis]